MALKRHFGIPQSINIEIPEVKKCRDLRFYGYKTNGGLDLI